jgi:NAD-specific glutamate dehydrogenase
MRPLWTAVGRDNSVNANAQYSMMQQAARLVRHATSWLLIARRDTLDIAAAVDYYAPGVAKLAKQLPKLLGAEALKRHNETVELYTDIGVPEKLAHRLAGLGPLYSSLDIVTVAREHKVDEAQVGGVLTSGSATSSASRGCATRSSACRCRAAGRRWRATACAKTCIVCSAT